MYLIVREASGEVITNTPDPMEAEYYEGARAVSFEDLHISGLGDMPAHPCSCRVNLATMEVSIDQAKKDDVAAQAAADAAAAARIQELYAATNPADAALATADRMYRIGRLERGLPEV